MTKEERDLRKKTNLEAYDQSLQSSLSDPRRREIMAFLNQIIFMPMSLKYALAFGMFIGLGILFFPFSHQSYKSPSLSSFVFVTAYHHPKAFSSENCLNKIACDLISLGQAASKNSEVPVIVARVKSGSILKESLNDSCKSVNPADLTTFTSGCLAYLVLESSKNN